MRSLPTLRALLKGCCAHRETEIEFALSSARAKGQPQRLRLSGFPKIQRDLAGLVSFDRGPFIKPALRALLQDPKSATAHFPMQKVEKIRFRISSAVVGQAFSLLGLHTGC